MSEVDTKWTPFDSEEGHFKPQPLHRLLDVGARPNLIEYMVDDETLERITHDNNLISELFLQQYFIDWVNGTERLRFIEDMEQIGEYIARVQSIDGMSRYRLNKSSKGQGIVIDGLVEDCSGVIFPIFFMPKLSQRNSPQIRKRGEISKLSDLIGHITIVSNSGCVMKKNYRNQVNKGRGELPDIDFVYTHQTQKSIDHWANDMGLKQGTKTLSSVVYHK